MRGNWWSQLDPSLLLIYIYNYKVCRVYWVYDFLQRKDAETVKAVESGTTWVGWMVWVPLFDCSASPGDGNAQAVHVFFYPCWVFLHGLDVNNPFFWIKECHVWQFWEDICREDCGLFESVDWLTNDCRPFETEDIPRYPASGVFLLRLMQL